MPSAEMATTNEAASQPLLAVRDLHVSFPSEKGPVRAVGGISFDMHAGELLAVVGESGSGKSVTAASIMRLLDDERSATSGKILFDGRNLLDLDDRQMSRLRGAEISIIFQDPLSALNPLMAIGHQVREALVVHGTAKSSADAVALRLLDQVEMPDPARQFRQYPHQLSGGMNQRAMIAIALAGDPKLLIADEPTTALDATTQIQIMELIRGLARRNGTAVLMITHDLGVVSDFADRVLIMYAGRLMEDASRQAFFTDPRHPYSRALLDATPRGRQRLDTIPGRIPDLTAVPSGCLFHPRCDLMNGRERCRDEVPALRRIQPDSLRTTACHFAEELPPRVRHAKPIASTVHAEAGDHADVREVLRVEDLTKDFIVQRRFASRRQELRAVDHVTFSVDRGETLALVGESGSGKSTTARLVLRLLDPTGGRILFRGTDVTRLSGQKMRDVRRQMGLIFQDPDSSLDPFWTAGEVVAEPLLIHGVGDRQERADRVAELLSSVGIDPHRRGRGAREFSGGERQRLAIARALALRPALIVCDEPTTMLDVSVQAQILTLLHEIQAASRVSFLFIAHDLAVVQQISHRVAVMYAGRIVEMCRTEELFRAAHHPYTVALLSASPDDPEKARPEEHDLASRLTIRPPDRAFGCPYATTCWKAEEICRDVVPPLAEVSNGHQAACHFPEGVAGTEAVGPDSPGTPS